MLVRPTMVAPLFRKLSTIGLLVFAIRSRWHAQAVGGGKARLVGQHLDRDRHAGERPHVLAARDRRIDRIGLRQRIVGLDSRPLR